MGESEFIVENREFGRYLRRIREERKLSLDSVEEMTSGYPDRVTKSHLSRIENGSAVPSFGKLFALSQIYGVPISAMAERFEIDLLRETQATDLSASTPADALAQLDRLEMAGNYREEVALASAMLDAIEHAGMPAEPEQIVALKIYRIDALAHLERYEMAKVQCEELLSDTFPTRRQKLQALLCFTICCYRLKRYTIAEMALVKATDELVGAEHPTELHATVTATRAVVQTALGQLDEAIDTYKAAISLYLQVPQPFEVCRAQLNLAQTLILLNRSEKALPYLRSAQATSKDVPHYAGHRKRLRDRFLKVGFEGMGDYEVIELILTLAIPRKDVKEPAKDLIKKFGNLKGILDARLDELRGSEGIGEIAAVALKIIRSVATTYLQQNAEGREIFSDPLKLAAYWRMRIGSLPNEVFQVGYLDSAYRLLRDGVETLEEGTIDRATVYPRRMVESALRQGASALVLAHNHPNGIVQPTEQDKLLTRALVLAAETVQLKIVDHLIVSAEAVFSFREAGLL